MAAFGTLTGVFSVAANSALVSNVATLSSGSGVVATGDLVFGVFVEQTNLTVSAVSDSMGHTYTATNAGTNAGTISGRAFYTRVTAGGTLTSLTGTATASTDNITFVAGVFTGPTDSPPVDANIANTTTGSVGAVYTCPATGTRIQSIELVVAWGARATAIAFTATAPNLIAIQLATQAVGQAVLGYQTSASTVSIAPVFTSAVSAGGSVLGTTSFKLTQLMGQGIV